MHRHRTAYSVLAVIALAAGFASSRGAWWKSEPAAETVHTAAEGPVPAIPAALEPHAEASPEVLADRSPEIAPAEPARVPAELLSVLHACMAPAELRPAADAPVPLAVNRRLLQDCMRGSDSRNVLKQLSRSLPSLESPDREDAALLMAYLADRLLRTASTTAQKAALLGPVLAAYRTVEGPHLQQLTERLLARAYMRSDDLRGVAQELQHALDEELEAGAVANALGPLLRTSFVVAYPGEIPQDALDAMEEAVGRAIPRAVELGLAAVRSGTEPYELRDGLRVLEDTFFAASRSAGPELVSEVPRILDALADLDVNRIRDSGVELRTLEGLLVQSESQLRKVGALSNEVPLGGRTSPAELRRLWGMDKSQGRARTLREVER